MAKNNISLKPSQISVDDMRHPLRVEVDETTVTNENITEAPSETTVPAGEAKFNVELMPGVVTVDEAQLNDLIDQNITMKTEIGQLVGLFKNFEGLINGKSSIPSLMMKLPGLISNPDIANQVAAIAPIIEKYSETE